MNSILIVEDDTQLNKLFSTVLTRHQYNVYSAFNGEEALSILENQHIDLIISDIMMPKIDGYELVESLRDAKYETPVLMITAKDSYQMLEKGFDIGADDYMVKPINVNELVLRVRALLKRAKIAVEKKIELEHTVLEYDSLTVHFNGEAIILPQKEFQILYKLISYPNKIFTRQQLMDEFWGLESHSDERTIDVHVNRIRERLKDVTDFDILTVRGLGYKAVKH
ncbi:response regulator transcription factor [Vagococcus zengguangii]|uniref:Heme response regulator HssR n=1 Tax=Vagococcus zengguangii TaxID=2571750 RepID=A0A4D7CU19_9ENTE|nr:response regulator transcription factor [Vagococcus zengguangii]QCI85830.1 response regulator transcription factor [Vagococcus zengguangii]TLG81771.1 response regulator transcription factor [Vagococcus zengguangii]